MVKKVTKIVAAELPLPTHIKESAQQLWTAGVGAINKAQAEGNRVFEALLREGDSIRENLQKRTRGAAGGMTEVTSRATDTWDRIEQVFEKRVERALGTLGVPSSSDLERLSARIDALTRMVEKMAKQSAIKPAVKSVAKAAKAAPKPVAKPTPKPRARKAG
jgi:poly(hydroxyalkanoate) granule-associated protein